MRVISRQRFHEFAEKHRDAKRPLDDWYREAKRAAWTSHQDVKAQYRNASIVRDCVVFNIGGSKFRLVAWIYYPAAIVYVKGVYTHREYDEAAFDCRRSS
jgi:mRNA interferase HigB